MSSPKADISENDLLKQYPLVLDMLLKDMSTGENILWLTDDYEHRGSSYQYHSQITVESITGDNGDVMQPRTYKTSKDQSDRTKEKAEVFTPSWVVNLQNNAIDETWFGREAVFNTTSEDNKQWFPIKDKIKFDEQAENYDVTQNTDKKTWQAYAMDTRLEITCGEAPYIVSRYDTATGEAIDIDMRVGILDRKLRIIDENTDANHDHEEQEWFSWVKRAYQSVYGFEWQGDNLFIARENLLFTFFDVYRARYNQDPKPDDLLEIAEIIAWNFWQMDGLKFVVPESCHEDVIGEESLFDIGDKVVRECVGCLKDNILKHNGVYCVIKDWKQDEELKFVDLIS